MIKVLDMGGVGPSNPDVGGAGRSNSVQGRGRQYWGVSVSTGHVQTLSRDTRDEKNTKISV